MPPVLTTVRSAAVAAYLAQQAQEAEAERLAEERVQAQHAAYRAEQWRQILAMLPRTPLGQWFPDARFELVEAYQDPPRWWIVREVTSVEDGELFDEGGTSNGLLFRYDLNEEDALRLVSYDSGQWREDACFTSLAEVGRYFLEEERIAEEKAFQESTTASRV